MRTIAFLIGSRVPSLADLQSIAIIPDGLQYREAISKDWSGAAYDDIIAATEQASTLPYVDRARVRRRLFRVPVWGLGERLRLFGCFDQVGALGASFGGYSTHPSEPFLDACKIQTRC